MTDLRISKKADEDLYEIGLYTEDKWGREQRRHYLDEINHRLHLLAQDPDNPFSKDIGHIKAGCFALPIHKHFIIYRKLSHGVRVIRVLGQVMDLERHL
ncbi:type II toxin-antitoxin system RelE/ParE family toxin [Bacterioplanoides sp.]|uniref:type II toxin-antitoxin system RelE/ParE family toxin n=1 Tax=Bacterioplanoides sp. TaxID=2066072 RepID=UPI003B00CA72